MTAIQLGNTLVYPAAEDTVGGMNLRQHMVVEAMKARIENEGVPIKDCEAYYAARIVAFVDRVLVEMAAEPKVTS